MFTSETENTEPEDTPVRGSQAKQKRKRGSTANKPNKVSNPSKRNSVSIMLGEGDEEAADAAKTKAMGKFNKLLEESLNKKADDRHREMAEKAEDRHRDMLETIRQLNQQQNSNLVAAIDGVKENIKEVADRVEQLEKLNNSKTDYRQDNGREANQALKGKSPERLKARRRSTHNNGDTPHIRALKQEVADASTKIVIFNVPEDFDHERLRKLTEDAELTEELRKEVKQSRVFKIRDTVNRDKDPVQIFSMQVTTNRARNLIIRATEKGLKGTRWEDDCPQSYRRIKREFGYISYIVRSILGMQTVVKYMIGYIYVLYARDRETGKQYPIFDCTPGVLPKEKEPASDDEDNLYHSDDTEVTPRLVRKNNEDILQRLNICILWIGAEKGKEPVNLRADLNKVLKTEDQSRVDYIDQSDKMTRIWLKKGESAMDMVEKYTIAGKVATWTWTAYRFLPRKE